MEIYSVRHSNVVSNFDMCCVVMIMQSMWFPVFNTKYNLNTMVAIYACPLKALQ